jgi:hypothetical protein
MGRKQWIEEAKAKIARWDSKLSELEARASAMGEEAKAEYHKLAGDARERLGKAKADLAEAEEGGGDGWGKMKERVQQKWKEHQQAFDEALETAEEPPGR